MKEESPSGQGREYICLARLSDEPEAYLPDIQPLLPVRAKYGPEEWDSIVLTHEFHGHLGAYTILGVKMGVLAKETLGAHQHELEVCAESGGKPPLNCMVDGLMTSTGSTYGRGLIKVSNPGEEGRVAASFIYKGKRIRIKLKPEWRAKIDSYVAQGGEEHGWLTPGYFAALKALALRVWEEFDRKEVFEVSYI